MDVSNRSELMRPRTPASLDGDGQTEEVQKRLGSPGQTYF